MSLTSWEVPSGIPRTSSIKRLELARTLLPVSSNCTKSEFLMASLTNSASVVKRFTCWDVTCSKLQVYLTCTLYATVKWYSLVPSRSLTWLNPAITETGTNWSLSIWVTVQRGTTTGRLNTNQTSGRSGHFAPHNPTEHAIFSPSLLSHNFSLSFSIG